MKKFGTPIAAAPGSDSEKVGFDAVGTPLPEGRLLFLLVVFFLAGVDPVVLVVDFCLCDEGRWALPRRAGLGVWVVELLLVVVELEVEVEELEVVELVVVVVELVVEVGEQDSVSEITTPVIGRFMAEIGVPVGTLTSKVRV
jgi:hypothetical protein